MQEKPDYTVGKCDFSLLIQDISALPGWHDKRIGEVIGTTQATIWRLKHKLVADPPWSRGQKLIKLHNRLRLQYLRTIESEKAA